MADHGGDDVSDRMYRAVQALRVDDYDDEFTISGTGQVIGNRGGTLYQASSPALGRYARPHASTPSDFPLFYLLLIAAALAGALLYHLSIRWLTAASHHVPPTTTSPPIHNTIQCDKAPSSLDETAISRKDCSSRSLTASTVNEILPTSKVLHVIPDLADDEVSAHPAAGAVVVVPSRDDKALVVLPGNVTTTMDDARHVVNLATMLEQACAEQGRNCDQSAALAWAANQQKTDKVLNARLGEEMRRYVYDGAQRTVDRSLSQQQHDEKLAAKNQDKNWLTKLSSSRDKSAAALGRSVFHCFVGSLFINVVRPVFRATQMWRALSVTEMVCYGTGTNYDPLGARPGLLASSPWYGRYASYSSADGLTSSVFGDAVTCLNYTIGRAAYFLLVFALLVVGTWVLRQLVIAERLQQLVASAYLLFVFSINGWVPELHLVRLVFSLAAGATAVQCLFWYQYKTFREKFRSLGTPQGAAVNESLAWFDDAASIVHMAPIFGGILWLLALKFGGSTGR